MGDEDLRYSLNDLTDATGVSVRTVRYYITEGLLPPPITAGPRTYYTSAHRDRLLLIAQYKAAFLPLREIRRQMVALSDEEVAALVARGQAAVPSSFGAGAPPVVWADSDDNSGQGWGALSEAPDTAADYLSRVMPRRERPVEPEAEHDRWRRVPVSDDLELLIREDAYQRHHEKVTAAKRWLRSLFT